MRLGLSFCAAVARRHIDPERVPVAVGGGLAFAPDGSWSGAFISMTCAHAAALRPALRAPNFRKD